MIGLGEVTDGGELSAGSESGVDAKGTSYKPWNACQFKAPGPGLPMPHVPQLSMYLWFKRQMQMQSSALWAVATNADVISISLLLCPQQSSAVMPHFPFSGVIIGPPMKPSFSAMRLNHSISSMPRSAWRVFSLIICSASWGEGRSSTLLEHPTESCLAGHRLLITPLPSSVAFESRPPCPRGSKGSGQTFSLRI